MQDAAAMIEAIVSLWWLIWFGFFLVVLRDASKAIVNKIEELDRERRREELARKDRR